MITLIEGPILAETFFDAFKVRFNQLCKRSMTRYLKQPEHAMWHINKTAVGNDDFSNLELPTQDYLSLAYRFNPECDRERYNWKTLTGSLSA